MRKRIPNLPAIILIGCLALLLTTNVTARAADDYPLAPAIELAARGGLPNFFARAAAGGELRVAYFGGSITAANGWRPKTTKWLTEQYPQAKITEINAAIGGTGSDLGVFRFRRDVLDHKPNLIFIEFAVNDGGAAPEQIYRCMEGIVRQALDADPTTDICFVYTLVEGYVPTLQGGKFPRAASAMEKIAGHYAIPSIHMGLEVVRLAKEGKMIMKANPKTEEEKAQFKDKLIFSNDGVHPLTETGHQLYLEAIQRSFTQIKGTGAAAPHKLSAPFVADNYQKAQMIPLDRAKLSPGWQKLQTPGNQLAKNFNRYLPQLFAAKQPGDSLTFRFKGTVAGFMDLLGPDCGQIQVTVDDGKPVTVARFDAYCTYPRIGSTYAAKDVPDAIHTITAKVIPTTLDKAAILAKNGNKIDDPKRFEGGTWYASWIMLVGEMGE